MLAKMVLLCLVSALKSSAGYTLPRAGGFVRPLSARRMLSSADRFSIACPSSVDIEKMGKKLATILVPGDVLFLQGDLGAGKTTLSRGIVRAKFKDPNMIVTSPSYLLDNTYRYGEDEYIHHMDLYRLPVGYKEMGILGIPGIFETALCLVEWPNRLESKFLPESYVDIRISIPSADTDISSIQTFTAKYHAHNNGTLQDPIQPRSANIKTDRSDQPHGCDSSDEYDSEASDNEEEPIVEHVRVVNFDFHGERWIQKSDVLKELFR